MEFGDPRSLGLSKIKTFFFIFFSFINMFVPIQGFIFGMNY